MASNPKPTKPVSKKYYDVKIECMLPATLTYRVLAEDEKQASELIKNSSPTSVTHKLAGRKEIKMTIYEAGTSMIKLILKIWNGKL